MAFKALDPEDFIVSSDSVTSTVWSNNSPSLNTFFSSSTQKEGSSGPYYLNVYQTASSDDTAAIQFQIAYANKNGGGGVNFDSSVPFVSSTTTIYGQYRTLILEDENASFVWGDTFTGSADNDFYAISIERARYKEKIFPGTFNLVLSGSDGTNPARVQLTDNSKDVTALTFTDAGRVFDIVSGTNGSAVSTAVTGGVTAGLTPSGSYGKFLPDVGLIILNPRALALSQSLGGVGLTINDDLTDTAMVANNSNLFESIKLAQTFSLNSEETITSDFVFVRVRNTDFNYSTNPSMISGSGEFVHSSLINNPQTFITTVGLYNDANELLSVAKLSKPLVKDFTKEALVRVKLDF